MSVERAVNEYEELELKEQEELTRSMDAEQAAHERKDVEENTNNQNDGTELELKRSTGVFELMIELRGTSMEGGTAKVIGVGNVESLQEERSWNPYHAGQNDYLPFFF